MEKIEKSLEDLVRSWKDQVITCDATAIANYETEDGYFSGCSDAYKRCIDELRKILARQRLRIV